MLLPIARSMVLFVRRHVLDSACACVSSAPSASAPKRGSSAKAPQHDPWSRAAIMGRLQEDMANEVIVALRLHTGIGMGGCGENGGIS